VRTTPNALMQLVEVLGVTGTTRFVVEALDRECPFPGLLAPEHVDYPVQREIVAFGFDPTYASCTEAEARATYGSLYWNAQGPAKVGARAAEPNDRRVLARAAVEVTPRGTSKKPMPFWDDFEDDKDTFRYVGMYGPTRANPGHFLESSRWYLYAFDPDVGYI